LLSSVPRRSDLVKSYPTRHWLEMYLIEPEKKKTSVFKDGKTYHVGYVEIDGTPFDLILDGMCYGKFGRIVITPILVNNVPLSFPLMTFLPHAENALHG